MHTETITLHTMTTIEGVKIQYARILRKCGRTTIGQSVLLSRLSKEQLKRAIEIHNTQRQ